MPHAPFTDPDLITQLYADPERLVRRTGSLHAAKISGADATDTIVTLAARVAPPRPVIWDIGCGRGTTTLALAAHLQPRRLVALDQSSALLTTVAERALAAGHDITTEQVDFHQLPALSGADDAVDVVVAAFCLYHSPRPKQVIAQIAPCLTTEGHAVLATKSVDSYAEIDQVVTALGLDPEASRRQSLYQTFHSANAEAVVSTALDVEQVMHQQHTFRFGDAEHLATYLSTMAKYELPDDLTGDPVALADALHDRVAGWPVITTSTVTYIVAARP